jgi:hypothetical protein
MRLNAPQIRNLKHVGILALVSFDTASLAVPFQRNSCVHLLQSQALR